MLDAVIKAQEEEDGQKEDEVEVEVVEEEPTVEQEEMAGKEEAATGDETQATQRDGGGTADDVPMEASCNDKEGAEESNDEEDTTLDDEVIKRIYTFVKTNPSQPGESASKSEFDQILNEMASTVEQLTSNGIESMQTMMDGWVEMEANDFCVADKAAEGQELMTLDALCGLTEPAQDAVDGEEDDDA